MKEVESMRRSDIKRIITAAIALVILLPACLSLTGCSNRLYALDAGGNRVGYLDADVIHTVETCVNK